MEKSSGANRNKIYFRILAILLSFFLLIIVEGTLRLFSYGTNLNLFVNHSSENLQDYYVVNPYVGEKYFNRFEATSGTGDVFLKEKPENGFRIFLMGSSTLYGYPYDKNLMASRILQKRLQDAYPDKTIEVVNTAITAINSITLKDYIRQIVKHQPDAILIYAGHNEFYGAFGVGSNETMSKNTFLRAVHFKLINLRIYQLMRSTISGISKQLSKKSGNTEFKGTLMKRIVKDKDIVYEGEKYNIGIGQFKNNIKAILDEANKKNIPVFLSDLVSNIKDVPPFGNIDEKDHSAKEKYQQAKKILAGGDSLLATEMFYKAKDLDPVRFRASEEINQIIHKLTEPEEITLVPAQKWFINASHDGLIGNNLLTEHVHPNIDGQFVLADAFYSKIVESELVDSTPNSATKKSKGYYRQNWGYTDLDSLIGDYKIKQLKSHWPFKSMDSDITFRDTFVADGVVDSLAFSVLTNPKTNVAALHNVLGGYYETNSNYLLALKEYEAMVHINPYRSDYYNKAANTLLKLNDLNAAEIYLKKSIKFNATYFGYSLLGEIEFIKHNYKGAIEAYQKALELVDVENVEVDDQRVLLTSLYKTYYLINDQQGMKNMLIRLENLGYKAMIQVQPHAFEYSNYIPYNIEQPFKEAISQYSTNLDSAFYYFSKCLAINDCPLVNYYMGNIMYQKKDPNVLKYYDKAYSGYRKESNFLVRFCVANIVNKNYIKAKEIFNELITIDPENRDLPMLRSALNR